MESVKQSKPIELYTKEGKRLYVYVITTGQYSDWAQDTYVSETKYTQIEIKAVYDEWMKIKKDNDTAIRSAIKKVYGNDKLQDRLKDPERIKKNKEYQTLATKINIFFNKKAGFTDNYLEGYYSYFPDFLMKKLDFKGYAVEQSFDYKG